MKETVTLAMKCQWSVSLTTTTDDDDENDSFLTSSTTLKVALKFNDFDDSLLALLPPLLNCRFSWCLNSLRNNFFRFHWALDCSVPNLFNFVFLWAFGEFIFRDDWSCLSSRLQSGFHDSIRGLFESWLWKLCKIYFAISVWSSSRTSAKRKQNM